MSRARVRGALLAVALATAPALAAPPAVPAEAPFTSDELAVALARRAPGRALPTLAVSYRGGRVAVRMTDRRVEVDLSGQTGVDAARVVALAILDSLESTPPPPPHDDRTLAPPPPPVTPADRPRGRLAPITVPALTVGVVASAGTRLAVHGELGARVVGAARAVLTGGWVPAATSGALTLTRYPVRATVAGQLGLGAAALEVRAGVVATIERATATSARSSLPLSSTEVVFGGGAAAAVLVPLATPRFALELTGGVDGYAGARTYTIDGTEVARSDRFVWWAGLGVTAEVVP